MNIILKYFKGKFLISKLVATIVILGLIILEQNELISNTLFIILTILSLISFFIIDSSLREKE